MSDKNQNLLIIDDELEITKSLVRQFKHKYNVYAATSAQQGIELMETTEMHVVISDQRMPGMTGVDFFAKIKDKYPDTVKLILTGFSDIDSVIGAINQGQVYRYLRKPWHPEELEATVNEAFEKHELIIENKNLTASLLELNANLEEKIKTRTENLNELNVILTASELKYKDLLHHLNAGVVVHGADAKILIANEQASKLLGFSSEQLIGKDLIDSAWDFVKEDGTVMPVEEYPFAQVFETKTQVQNLVLGAYQPQTKEIVWALVNAFPELDSNNEIQQIVVTFIDITERKNDEAALRDSEEKFRTLFEKMNEMVVLHSLIYDEKGEAIDYRIEDCNPVFTKIKDITYEDTVGKLASEFYNQNPPPYLAEYAQVASTGQSIDFEMYYPPLDRDFQISVVSPRKGTFATITSDITETKRFNEMLVRKNNELENYVYVASHDLRSPLVNIQGFSSRLKSQIDLILNHVSKCVIYDEDKEKVKLALSEKIPTAIEYIFNNVEKMDGLLNGLLQISRTGRMTMNIKAIHTKALFDKIIQSFDFQFKEINAEVKVEELPGCYGDENMLNQLFSNIIGNALKYRSAERKLEIKISGEFAHRKTIYRIQDNGIGISEHHLEKIWNVFYRVDPKHAQGDGIGLSVVKRIVDKHHGRIWVESTVGVGTAFIIELPNIAFNE